MILIALLLFAPGNVHFQDPFVRVPQAVGLTETDTAAPVSLESVGDITACVSTNTDSWTTTWVEWAVSVDNGRTWRSDRLDYDRPFSSSQHFETSAVVAGGQVLTCWSQILTSGGEGAYFRRLPAGTAAFEPILTLDAPRPGVVTGMAMVGEEGARVAVAFARSNGDLAVCQSLDGGANFFPAVIVHTGAAVSDIKLLASGDDVFLIWLSGDELLFQSSANFGQTWQPIPRLLNPGLSAQAGQLDFALGAAGMAATFVDTNAGNAVHCTASSDSGATWSTPAPVGNSQASLFPQVFVGPQEIVAAWQDHRQQGTAHLFLSWSDDMGATWTENDLGPMDSTSSKRAHALDGNPGNGVYCLLWTKPSGEIFGTWSRSFVSSPRAEFLVADLPPLSGASCSWNQTPVLAYNQVYGEATSAWGSWRCPWWVPSYGGVTFGGFRNAQVEPVGTFVSGSIVGFEAYGMPEAEAGDHVQVLVSLGRGGAVLPAGDGRALGLAFDPVLLSTAGNPAFLGVVGPDGDAAVGPLVLPMFLTPGTTLHFSAVTLRTGPLRFGSLADAQMVVVQ